MRTSRIALALLLAAVALGAGVTTASANRLSFSNNTFRVAFTEPGEVPAGTIACAATLSGSFHSRSIAKVTGALIGFVTRAQFREETCRNGTGRFLRETLPWHVTYEGFTGTLPDITSVKIQVIGMAIAWTLTGFPECLMRTTTERPGKAILAREAGGALTTFRWDETASISGTGTCFESETHVFGTTSITEGSGSTTLTVTLI